MPHSKWQTQFPKNLGQSPNDRGGSLKAPFGLLLPLSQSPIPTHRTKLTCDVEDVVGDAGRCHRALGGLSLQNGHHGLQLVQGPCQA